MTKVAIKYENITPFGGIYHVMDVFLKLDLGELIESVLGKRGNSGKAFSYGDVISSFYHHTKILYGQRFRKQVSYTQLSFPQMLKRGFIMSFFSCNVSCL